MVAKTDVEATHYMVLSLRGPSQILNKSELKAAYHRALLQHHPDKGKSYEKAVSSSDQTRVGRTYSIDQIVEAYKTLSDPVSRAEYDRKLKICALSSTKEPGTCTGTEDDSTFRIGLELYDLDDLEMEEGNGPNNDDIWYHACRCGEARGFLVTESELEREAEWGEIIVGCRGCSLWAKITFVIGDD
ncbi:hypothetical protein KEM54_001136 [Ascosphaera aggregata]|nr:hypothetical protein KEM54_001136 [Ascosphaera aggregata]